MPQVAWHAIWTRSHCERLVHDQLVEKGFETLLPEVELRSVQGRKWQICRMPLFPGYVLIHSAMDKSRYIEAMKVRGLVRILGERWDRLARIPDHEVDAIRRVVECPAAPRPHPYLCEGRRVRVVQGPLAGVAGVLVRQEPHKGLLVVSIDMFQRSVAVEVEYAHVRAA